MGHKVHPLGFRIGIIRDWQAKWYADAHYVESLHEDLKLRQAIGSRYAEAAVSLVEIDRQAKEVSVTIHTARPGIVIGRGGQRVDELRLHLEKLIGKRVRLNIQEIRQPELDANLVAKTIAEQIQRRIAYRRAIKQAIFRTIQAGAKGIRVSCSGRLGDVEIARRQTMHQGQVPLHTLRADIDYGFTEARTTLGRIGVKVWIYKGEILPEPKRLEVEEMPVELAASKGAEVELPTAAEAVAEVKVEEKPAEPVVAESAEVAPEVKPEEKPAKPAVRRRVKAAVPTEQEEKPAKPAARRRVKAAVPTEQEEKPPKPAVRRRVKAAVSTEQEEKPPKPAVRRRVKAAASTEQEEKPAKPTTRRSKKATPAAEPEKNITQPAVDITTEAEASTLTEKEEKDAAT